MKVCELGLLFRKKFQYIPSYFRANGDAELLCEQNSKHGGAKNKRISGQKQVLLNHICNSEEERYLACGRQTIFRGDVKEWYVRKYTKNKEKQTTFSSDLIFLKMAKRSDKIHKSMKNSYEERTLNRRYRKKRPLSPNGKL